MLHDLLIVIGLLALIPILILIIILLLSSLDAYFMGISQGTTVFISASDKLVKILPNVGGYMVSTTEDLEGRHWLVPEKDEEKRTKAFFHNSFRGTLWFQRWLWKRFGIRFISWFWPKVHIHRFDIRKGGRRRIVARSEVGADAPLRSRVVDSEGSTEIDHLLFLIPRPVYLEGAELAGDNSKINLLLLPVFRQVIPVLPSYYLKGDFFTLLDAAIEAAVVDFCATHKVAVYKSGELKGQFAQDFFVQKADGDTCEESRLTYAHWLKLTKAGEGSPLERQFRQLNVSRAYLTKLKEAGEKRKELQELIDYIENHLAPQESAEIPVGKVEGLIPSGIVPRFGFALVSFRLVEWEAHKSTVALAEALLAKETEFHIAEGVRKKADGESYAIQKRAEGESSRYKLLAEALVKNQATGNMAAEVVLAQIRTENIRDSKTITTYVEGGTPTSVMVPASPSASSTK